MRRPTLALPVLAAALLATAAPAAAHEHACVMADGTVRERDASTRQCPAGTALHIVVGWTTEPPLVGEPNGLDLALRAVQADGTEAPLQNVTTLTARYEFGGRTFPLDLRPQFGAPGAYTDDIKPTRPGTYTLRLGGTVEGIALNLTIEPQEVTTAGDIEFPEPSPDVGALQARVAALEAEVAALKAQRGPGGSSMDVTPDPPPGDRATPGPGPLLALAAAVGAAMLVARRRGA